MSESTNAKAVSVWSYEGRSSRSDYFVVILLTVPAGTIVGLMMGKGGALGFFGALLFAALLWVSMCASARRMHDVGHSGWWTLIALVPGANIFFGLYALFAPGQQHDNNYGPSPSLPESQPQSPLSAQCASKSPLSPSGAQVQHSDLMQVDVNIEATTQVPGLPEAVGVEPLEEFWAQALHECESATMKAGLWAKSFSDADGDERVAKASYMRLRAAQLQKEYLKEQQALKLAHDQELQAEEERQKAQEKEVSELLAKMEEAKRAEALLPKGRCPACDDVIPLISEQCPSCTALFTADSKWRVKPLSRYEAIAQKAVDDAVLNATRTKEEKESANARELIILGVVLILCVVAIVNS